MESVLLIIQIVLVFLITVVVLLQKSSSLGLGSYSSSNDGMFGAKGPAGFLAKATVVLGLLFLANTIALGYLYNKQTSLTDDLSSTPANPLDITPSENPFGAPLIPQAPSTPLAPSVPPTPNTQTNSTKAQGIIQ
ncbi:preprotein translocase subunit SecG [Helicobacter sp. 10-6591]|uniref:preprotein translocase subunit SecG n=1 Tax=Helicobacter sp. 10-6591 TaxID=2004998 RepID=UPI000DCD9D15|nr:preprotein translocase subunit SecG [Helicobacter sp. 10-6591]MCI7484629.1 preprotein translocase subunit SecG [Helicobacter sp.]RAX53798.1 preprotein translocase subunit SecG [Helicobacter sp. 10-6591]